MKQKLYTATIDHYTVTVDHYTDGENPDTTDYCYTGCQEIKFQTINELKQKIAEQFNCRLNYVSITHNKGCCLDISWYSANDDGTGIISDEIFDKFKQNEAILYSVWMPAAVSVTYDVDCSIFQDQLLTNMDIVKLTAAEFRKILDEAYGVIIDEFEYGIYEDYELADGQLVTAFVHCDEFEPTDVIIIPAAIEQNNNVIYNPAFRTFTYENSNIPSFRILKVFTLQ